MLTIPYKHPYANVDACAQRLFNNYKEHGKLIIAFDFDNTIFDYHNTGGDFSEVISLLQKCNMYNFTMVLFTSNEGERLEFCKKFCAKHNIRIDYVNESPIMPTRKPFYSLLLDDRAGLGCAIMILDKLICLIHEDTKFSPPKHG